MPQDTTEGERIAKVLARAGLCSRREAERAIAEGRVTVDGVTLDTPAFKVGAKAKITFDGKAVAAPAPAKLWRYHKPRGLVTSNRDEKGRPTVFEALPKSLPRVISVGRLDINSEGLLLLTNDGGLARRLELPSTGWRRRYRVRVRGNLRMDQLAAYAKGVTIDGVRYGPVEVALEKKGASNVWLTVSLAEGKNREVRRLMEHAGLTVSRLIRTSFGPFRLGQLEPGEVAMVSPGAMREHLGSSEGEKARRESWAKPKKPTKRKLGRKPRPKKKSVADRRR